MDYKATHFPFLQEDCIGAFGEPTGATIYAKACERLAEMLASADFRNNKSIEQHISKNMFPTIAYYLVLLEQGHSQADAYAHTLKVTQKAAQIQKDRNKWMGQLPFAYPLLKSLMKGMMGKMYPPEGWSTQWVKLDQDEIHMNFHSCIYADLTAHYGCPELCTVFCKNDLVIFEGYGPKIRFWRNGTLAEGADCCDFHFSPARK